MGVGVVQRYAGPKPYSSLKIKCTTLSWAPTRQVVSWNGVNWKLDFSSTEDIVLLITTISTETVTYIDGQMLYPVRGGTMALSTHTHTHRHYCRLSLAAAWNHSKRATLRSGSSTWFLQLLEELGTVFRMSLYLLLGWGWPTAGLPQSRQVPRTATALKPYLGKVCNCVAKTHTRTWHAQ